MHRIDGPGATVDNKFTDGDPVGGVQATMVTDDWLNDVQENIMSVLVAAGVAPTKGRAADLLDSIKALARGRLIGVQVFNTPGTFTYTPSLGMGSVVPEVQGGGAAGAGLTTPSAGNVSLGAPGTSGSYAKARILAAAIGASQTITVGAGGVAALNAPGGNGGSSSVGSLITAQGGLGGGILNNQAPGASNGNGGLAGTPTGGNIFQSVGSCPFLSTSISAGSAQAGGGGASIFGNGGTPAILNAPGVAAANYGAGGSGCAAGSGGAPQKGGDGKGGIVIMWEYAA